MIATNNITVPSSGLSQLQKRILVYARQRMIEQGQAPELKDNRCVTLCFAAPDWLEQALVALSEAIKRRRQRHICDGKLVGVDHPVINLISEAVYIANYLQKAAHEAGEDRVVDITKLYECAIDKCLQPKLEMFFRSRVYSPWPWYMDGRLIFYFWIEDANVDANTVRQRLGQDIDTSTAWISPEGSSYPANCTMPEMLRDLYGFPVRSGGDIVALAFDPEAIGKDVYNKANASLRRACDRLRQRGLLVIDRAQQFSLWSSIHYQRTGIGLTGSGVVIADELLDAA